MYTNEHQTYTQEEQRIKAEHVFHAIQRAYEAMEDGSIGAITYHVQTVHKTSPAIVHADYTIVDSGDRIESGILTVRYGDSRVSMSAGYNGPHILLEWFKDTHASAPMTELLLAIDPRAVIWTISDVIDQIWVDDGLDETDLLEWYNNVCLQELYTDVTDQEAQEFQD